MTRLGRATVVAAAAVSAAFLITPAWGQAADPRVDRTEHFTVFTPPAADAARALVLGRVEALHLALSQALAIEPVGDVTLRVYTDLASAQAANPLAVVADGALAYPRRARRDVSVLLADGLPASEWEVALRLELAHRALVDRADGRLPEVFQEGVALYLAGLGAAQTGGVARLREAWSRDGLRDWSDLAGPGAAYLEPTETYPQARSMAQYLVEAYGYGAVLRWLSVSATATGWRQALESAFGLAPDRLEADWRAWLPSYLDGGWRRLVLSGGGSVAAVALLADGGFAAAAALAGGAAAAGPAGVSPEEARALAERIALGARSLGQLESALAALAAGDYAAAGVAEAAAAGLRQSGDARRAAQADEVARRAALGRRAEGQLRRAGALPPWRAVEARALAARAGDDLAQLGNDAAARRAALLLAGLDRRLAPTGGAFVLAGVGLLAWNLRRRRLDRAYAAP